MQENPRPQVGDPAPDFELEDQHGGRFRLSTERGRSVVLYFYPRDGTFGCTREACGFRDALDEFEGLGAEVVGVSADSVASHRRFAERRRLPFRLLSDGDRKVRRLYGAAGALPGVDPRITFIIDAQGIVAHVFPSQIRFRRHVAEAIATLRGLPPAGGPPV